MISLTGQTKELPVSRPASPTGPAVLVLLLIIIFALFFSALAVRQHHTFQTNGLDLGNVDQALWNTARGDFLHFTLMTPIQSRLALHVEPILLLFVPFYWFNLGSPELLLIVQATLVALGAWPVYQLTISNLTISNYQLSITNSRFNAGNWVLVIFPLAYLLLPTLEAAVLYDFHAVTMASTFLLFAFWALEQRRDGYFLIFVVLAMACKEDIPLVVAMLGLYAGLARRRWRLAGFTIGLSLVWFVVALFVIQPFVAAGGNIQLDRYAWLGNNLPEMVQTALTQPGLIFGHLWVRANLPDYLSALFFPTAFLALFSPLTLLPMLPTLAINLLSANPFTWRLEDFHYGAPLAPFLFISAIYGIKRIGRWVERADRSTASTPIVISSLTFLLLLFTVIYHYHRGFTPLARPFLWPQLTAHHRQLAKVIETIPAEKPLFTQSNLAPHLTHRPTLYTDFAYFTDPDYPAIPVEEILLDVTGFENIGGLHQFLRQTLLESGRYQVVTARDGLLHLRPLPSDAQPPPAPAASSPVPPAFYTFTAPDFPAQYTLTVDFGDVVRLRGFSLYFNREEEVQVSIDLEPRQPLAGLQPVLYLLDGRGQPVGATVDRQPALVWFPPGQWPPGKTVRVHFNTLPWHTRSDSILTNSGNGTYGLALGLINGDDVWEIGSRQRPAVRQSGRWATRLPADGSLVQLARLEQVWGIPEGGPMARQFELPDPPRSLQANFDNQVRLLGYTPLTLSDSQPHLLSLSLHWQAVAQPQPLTRFVQLIGPDGRVYSQNDSAPDFGNYPTQLWQPGEIVIEQVTLPVSAEEYPPGSYTLHVGLYRPDTGQRLSLLSGGDHVEIAVPFFNVK